MAPTEVQNQWNQLQAIQQREKDKVIAQMLVNVSMADRQAHYERLNRRDLDELQNDLAMMPKVPTQEEVDRTTAAASTNNRRAKGRSAHKEDEDMLGVPTINWTPVAEGKQAELEYGKGQTNNEAGQEEGEETEEEWLQKAPTHIRNRFYTATAIEEREKRKLIEELTANVHDEEQERRLSARLQSKSLDELKDLAALSPRKEERKPNYFGASAATTINRSAPSHSDPNEDVLPIPTFNWGEVRKDQSA